MMSPAAALPSLLLAAAFAGSQGAPVPECKPASPYNAAQAWWISQLPPPGDGGARVAAAVVSVPIYLGCGVADILAFPVRAVYNAAFRCGERKAALATNRELSDEIAKAQQRRARIKELAAKTPPRLQLTAAFDDQDAQGGRRNNMLDAEEAAQLLLTVRNEGPGPAHGVFLAVERERGPAEFSLGELPAIGDLPPGKSKTLRVHMTAAETLSRGELVLRVEAKEELGYDADPVLLVVPAAGLPAPDLEVAETGTRGGEPGELALGVPISLRLRIRNQGEGLARDVRVRITARDGEINLARPDEVLLGDIGPLASRDAAFQLSLTKKYRGPQDLPIFAVISERHPVFSKPPQKLPLRLGAKLGSLRAAAADSRRPPKLEYQVAYQDRGDTGIFEGGKELVLTVRIKNAGPGPARGVAVALSGSKGLVELLGHGRLVGDMGPGQEETVVFQGTLPGVLPAKESLDIRLSEALGYAPAQVKRISFSFKSAAPVIEKVVDVDKIPSSSWKAPDRFAVVIGVGKHRDPGIPGLANARADAQTMARYLENAGGVRPERLRLLLDENALMSDLKSAFEEWLPQRTRAAAGEAEVVVFYAGHGTPDPVTGEYYLVPFEGNADYREALYPLSKVYAALERLKAKRSVVVLDACFAGGGRSLAPSGRPLIPARQTPIPPRTAVLAASSGTQTSHEKKDSGHGLFTYFVLAGLQGEADLDQDGRVDLAELADYLRKTVPRAAAEELGATQEPDIQPEKLGTLGPTVLTGY